MNRGNFCWKTKNHNLQDVVNVEKQDWNEAGGRPFACLWSLWSHTKSNRPLIWWLRPWKSSPPSEDDVRGRAWSFSRQREGSFTSQHQDVWIKDKPSGDCHILQAYTATDCHMPAKVFSLKRQFQFLYWVQWFKVLQAHLSRSHSESCQHILPSQRGQTAEMSPPVASERVSVVVTWLGSLLTRFFVTEWLFWEHWKQFCAQVSVESTQSTHWIPSWWWWRWWVF